MWLTILGSSHKVRSVGAGVIRLGHEIFRFIFLGHENFRVIFIGHEIFGYFSQNIFRAIFFFGHFSRKIRKQENRVQILHFLRSVFFEKLVFRENLE